MTTVVEEMEKTAAIIFRLTEEERRELRMLLLSEGKTLQQFFEEVARQKIEEGRKKQRGKK